MADQFEELLERLWALETRVDAEVTAVQQHFAELQKFITFSLEQQSVGLRTEFREELKTVQRGLEYRLDTVDRRLDGMDQRFGTLEAKLDAYQHANQTSFQAILSRLFGMEANQIATQTALDKVLTRLPALEANQAATQTTLDEILSRLPKNQ